MASIASSIFTPATAARFDKLIYPVKRSALVPMLLYAQDDLGYVSDAAVAEIAQRLDLLELDVRNVLSYYSMLRTVPAGKYNVQVCTNISCMLRGGFELLDHCKHKLGIGHKGVTPDGLFSLEEVECARRLRRRQRPERTTQPAHREFCQRRTGGQLDAHPRLPSR
jgi:NADH-quinone oxidoreductase subunit E